MENNSIKHAVFDLDGTLINSYQTILKATLKTLEYLNVSVNFDEDEFRRRIGLHFLNIFEDLKIPVTDVEHFISIYKNFYFDFIDDSKIYAGVVEVLDFLKEKNIYISLLTTKGQMQADKIINHFNLRKYFTFVMGRRPGIAHKPSPEPLLFICNELKIKPEETIFTGDTELDISCGKNAGTKTCAVTYGYRAKEVLQKEKPDYIISQLKELIALV